MKLRRTKWCHFWATLCVYLQSFWRNRPQTYQIRRNNAK